mmetsp:Transcript_15004/g.41313  ORF Transcript_15004/g.41313 Transcript_15004/m.41313 type:complete len:1181 (-) Transcript_15004:43-3585(-)
MISSPLWFISFLFISVHGGSFHAKRGGRFLEEPPSVNTNVVVDDNTHFWWPWSGVQSFSAATGHQVAYEVKAVVAAPETEGSTLGKFWVVAVSIYLMVSLLSYFLWNQFLETEILDKTISETIVTKAPNSELHRDSDSEQEETEDFAVPLRGALTSLWIAETSESCIIEGSKAMLVVVILMFAYRFFRFCWFPDCLVMWTTVRVAEFVGLIAVGGFIVWCIKRPTMMKYWTVVFCMMLYMPAVSLPPFQWGCSELAGCMTLPKAHWYVDHVLDAIDCSLQGQTATLQLMSWLLLSPWIIPRMGMMWLMWLWFVVTYLGWTSAYFCIMNEMFFDWKQVLVRFGVLSLTLCAAHFQMRSVKRSSFVKFVADRKKESAAETMCEILGSMVPPHVLEKAVMEPEAHIAEKVRRATVLFIMIEDFDRIHEEQCEGSCQSLLNVLNKLFTSMDEIFSKYEVTKIETIKEEYVAAVGVTPGDIQIDRDMGHGVLLDRLFKAVNEIFALQAQHNVKFRMGLHTGEVIGGVIGKKLPRYRLFGDTMNTAARMMQKGQSNNLQFGEATKEHTSDLVTCVYNGEVEMKGKGPMKTWLFESVHTDLEATPRETERPEAKPPTVGKLLRKLLLPTGASTSLGETDTVTNSLSKPDVTQQPGSRQRLASSVALRGRRTSTYGTVKEDAAKRCSVVLHEEPSYWQSAVSALGHQRIAFTAEMEEEWRMDYHQHEFCRKLVRRGDQMIKVLCAITALDTILMISSNSWHKGHDIYAADHRLPVFVFCRTSVIVLIMALQFAFKRKLCREPALFQGLVTAGTWLAVLLLYVSYDAVCVSQVNSVDRFQNRMVEEGTGWSGMAALLEDERLMEVVAPEFALVFFILTRALPFRVVHMESFIVLAVMVTFVVMPLRGSNGLYFSLLGRLMFIFNAIVNAVLAMANEANERKRYMSLFSARVVQQRTATIIKTLMPPLVVKEMCMLQGRLPSHPFKEATIAQSDLCGFTAIASKRNASQVVKLLGDLFGRFDVLTEKFSIYKVETVGDAYIAGQAEQPLTITHSPTAVILFGLAMVKETLDWAEDLKEKVTCRVGVHHGACLGGVVGTEMQRYHLFGALMSGVEVLESTAPEGGVQVSKDCKEATRRALILERKPEDFFHFAERQEPTLNTSKGEVHSYDEVGGKTFVVTMLDTSPILAS